MTAVGQGTVRGRHSLVFSFEDEPLEHSIHRSLERGRSRESDR
jgi:hypothetical protein